MFDTSAIRRSNGYGPSRANALAFVRDDLRAKQEACAANLGRGGKGLGDDIIVQVSVVDPRLGRVNNYKVFASYAWLVEKEQPYQFDTLSSPAQTRLPPGKYVLWASNDRSHSRQETHYIDVSPQYFELLVSK